MYELTTEEWEEVEKALKHVQDNKLALEVNLVLKT